MFKPSELSVKEVRIEMGLSQSELASTLGISTRAIQSYEQGWRKPSDMVGRMLLLLLISHRNGADLQRLRCWEQKECSPSVREKCVAHKTRQGHLCWFLTGTLCEGQRKKTWAEKRGLCLTCGFLEALLSPATAETESVTMQP